MLTYTAVPLFSNPDKGEAVFRVQSKQTFYNVTVARDEVLILAPGLEEHLDRADLPQDTDDEALALISVATWENSND